VANRLDRSLVQGFEAFEGLSGDDLDDILRNARAKRYAKGTAVFRQGDEAEAFFVLLDGRLKVVQTTPDGRQVVVRFVNPGELFGIAAAIGRRDYPGTAVAADESVALAWDMDEWPALVARHPRVATNTLKTIGSRLQEQQTKVREMSTERVERRIAHVLLRLARQAGRRIETGVEIEFPITRQDIAEMTAATLFTVSRVMSAWEQAGIVEGGRQRIVVRDSHALVRVAEGLGGRPAATE
jgi:CRP/FNR family transcriptional regulator, nitrogen oxide reductase regulator